MSKNVKKGNWSKKEDKKLVKMISERMSYDIIAENLNRTKGAVATRVSTLRKKGVTIAAQKRGRRPTAQKQEAPKAVKVAKKVLESSNANANQPKATTGQTLVKNVAKEMERLVLYTSMLEKQNIALTKRLLEIEKIVRD
jgi:biotin operon repressor